MHLLEAIRLALRSLWANKLKSVFSLIGVFIGVTFLIAVVSIVNGMNRYMTERFANTLLGVNTFHLRRRPNVNVGDTPEEVWRSWARRPRITYEDAVSLLQQKGNPIRQGDDFGGDEETLLSSEFDKPVIIHRYPSAIKAFYMENDPHRPDLALCMDVLAPEGYGEIIGGGQRIHDYDKLLTRIRDHKLPEGAFRWYLDLRKYGAVPHAGFGMGIERAVTWICGIEHVRETIPFPRMLYKLYP